MNQKLTFIFLISCLIVGLLYFGINKSTRLKLGDTLLLGHGGSGFSGPFSRTSPNSMRSFEKALLEYRLPGVETDVQVCKDGNVILYHNEFLESSTHCEGNVTEMDWEDIQNCCYDRIFEDSDDKVWSLDSLLEMMVSLNYTPKLSLDIKFYSPEYIMDSIYMKTINALSFTLHKYGWERHTLLESVNADFLDMAHEKIPDVKLFYYTKSIDQALDQCQKFYFDGISIQNRLISKEDVNVLHKNGFEVMIWGTKSNIQSNQAIEKGADFLQTDALDDLAD